MFMLFYCAGVKREKDRNIKLYFAFSFVNMEMEETQTELACPVFKEWHR